MRQNHARTCATLLEQVAAKAIGHARTLQQLERLVRAALPADLAAHCSVMNLKKETLVLATDSPAWAARLRFAVPGLVKQLQCQLSTPLTRAEIRVRPVSQEIQESARHPPALSMASATLLARTAEGIENPALREALYRLAAKASES